MISVGQSKRGKSASLPALNFQAFFESAPGAFLVVLPNDPVFTIVAVSNAYVQVSGVRREDLLGRGLFEVFPDSADDPAASGVQNLCVSFRRAIASRTSDQVTAQRYDVKQPAAEGDGF